MGTLTPDEWVAILLSLKVAGVATACSLPLGILVALVLARGRFPGKTILDGLVHLPLVLPPVVTGYALLLTLRPARRRSASSSTDLRHRVLVPLDRRGAGLRGDGLSA